MAQIKEREIITNQPYCSNCREDINQSLTRVIDVKTLDVIHKLCPHCSEVIENV